MVKFLLIISSLVISLILRGYLKTATNMDYIIHGATSFPLAAIIFFREIFFHWESATLTVALLLILLFRGEIRFYLKKNSKIYQTKTPDYSEVQKIEIIKQPK